MKKITDSSQVNKNLFYGYRDGSLRAAFSKCVINDRVSWHTLTPRELMKRLDWVFDATTLEDAVENALAYASEEFVENVEVFEFDSVEDLFLWMVEKSA